MLNLGELLEYKHICCENEIYEIIMGLKKCSLLLSRHLSGIFNYFIEKGVFPEILKRGMISPIYKKGDSRYLDNYRPVSTLPVLDKILEKIIYTLLHEIKISLN